MVTSTYGTSAYSTRSVSYTHLDGAVLLNFSRDTLVIEADLLAAMESGKVGKYVTDFATDGTFGKDGIIVLPHLGASTAEADVYKRQSPHRRLYIG